jgi:rifampicin phosphotransferase
MDNMVFHLDQIRPADTYLVGNKAAALGALMGAGFPVPGGVCITTTAFSLAMQNRHQTIQDIISRSDLHHAATLKAAADRVAALLVDLSVPSNVIAELESVYPQLHAVPVAVRSSSTAEDQAEASFAGQYMTELGVVGIAAIQAAILACWRSFYHPHALLYRAQQNMLDSHHAMGVIIQLMIDAECAGVCFSVDPVQQRRDLIVINAAWGLGVGVVDGDVASDTAWVQRSGFQVERHQVSEKSWRIGLSPGGGVKRIAVGGEQSKAACLPQSWAQRIAQFSVAAELALGQPQDVEWAIADQQVWLLQSRPITALPPELQRMPNFPVEWMNEQDSRHHWSLMEESGAEPLPPLEQDHIRIREAMREETCRFLGADRNLEVRFFNGRAYSRPLALNLSEGDKRIRRQAMQDLQNRLHEQRLTAWDYWGPEIIRATERLRAFDATRADGDMLADHLEDALAVRRRHYMFHPMCWFNPPRAYYEAFAHVTGQTNQIEIEATADLFLDSEETPLTRLIDTLYTLAQYAQEQPAVKSLVLNPPADVLNQLTAMPEAAAFRQQFDEFLMLYGERTGDGWGSEATIRTATWRENPQEALRMVAPFLDARIEAPAVARARAQQERAAQFEALCSACYDPNAMEKLREELAYAQKTVAVLELHNHYIDQMATGQLHHAVMAAARWLVQRGVLTRADDIFWLLFDEILSALRFDQPADYTQIITTRRAEYADWHNMTAPPMLGIPDVHLPDRPGFQDDTAVPAEAPDGMLMGQGASQGQHRGRAHVVMTGGSPKPSDLKPGDVLVAANVGPRWTPLFPLLGGLVLDGGSIGQHAAVTAREYGVPAVIGARWATQRIRNGDHVTLDGTTGRVEYQRS